MFCRRLSTQLPALPLPSDRERILWLLIVEARAQIAASSGASDSHDVKALGLLGADAAAIIGLAAARSALPSLWWVAEVALAVAVPFFLYTIREGDLVLGPDVGKLFTEIGRTPAADAAVRLLGDLQGCLARNRRMLVPKQRSLALGLGLFIAGSLFSATFLLRMALVR